MKAITLHQPWASLWVHGVKIHETRGYRTHHRGLLAIHAGQHTNLEEERDILRYALRCADVAENYAAVAQINTLIVNGAPRGLVLGTVELTNSLRMDTALIHRQTTLETALGNWQPGRFAWKAENPTPFRVPIEARGKQGLWNWTEP